jgi:glutamine synthetase
MQGEGMGSKKKSTTRGSSATPKATAELGPTVAASAPEPELWQRLEAEGVKWAKIGGFDIDGVLRGKYVSLAKLRSALASGFGFCDVIFGWDVADALYSDAKVTGWHTGYPDAHAVLDPSTLRRIPWEPGVVAILADFRTSDGADHPACPRSLFRRVLKRAKDQGFDVKFGAEYEFFLFRETRETLVAKNYQNLTPLDPGMYGYSWLRTGQDSDLMREILDGMQGHGIDIEGFHTETGPGVYEAAIRYDDALVAADKAALFKTALKQIVSRHGLSVTFMAKFSGTLPGAGGHLHQSLWQGKSNVFSGAKRSGLSPLLKNYIGGQLALMPELTALYSPTINSYKRYVPGVWAPLSASWGVENRTCSVRVIEPNSPSAARVEYRHGHLPRRRPVGHRDGRGSGRASPGRRRRRTRQVAHLAQGGDRATGEKPHGQEDPRRRLRRPLCAHAQVGGVRVRARGHGLGAPALLRDHLMASAVRPQAHTVVT